MSENYVYKRLGKLTEEMYLGIEKTYHTKKQDQLVEYHAFVSKKLNELGERYKKASIGEKLEKYRKEISVFNDDFLRLQEAIDSKYKVFLRGCGKAGKSTLLNALLSIDEKTGSRMGKVPMTFTIDTYSDDLPINKAEIRIMESDAKIETLKLSRNEALKMEDKEDEEFKKSKEECDRLIERQITSIHNGDAEDDIKRDIYRKHLIKTKIREIKWGIGQNNFFHNCVLVDTPGLEQDLRFSNVLDDIKNYEMDGIIWVISSGTLMKGEVQSSYEKEFKAFEEIYKDKKVVGVINMYGTGDEYKYGSRTWQRIKEGAERLYLKRFSYFDEIICVNAKMAYEGNLAGNQKMIEESNISELRKKINEMFIEKSGDDQNRAKLDKMESFIENYYRVVERQLNGAGYKNGLNDKGLRGGLEEYRAKDTSIKSQIESCKELLRNELKNVVSNHMKEVSSRIDQNLIEVRNLENKDIYYRKTFVCNTIVRESELNKKLDIVIDRCYDVIVDRFKSEKKKSIISLYKTEEYIIKEFSEIYNKDMIKKEKSDLSLDLKTGGEKAFDFVSDIIGTGFVAEMAKGLFGLAEKIFGKSSEEKLKEKIECSLNNYIYNINLDNEISAYAKQCKELLDKSMQDVYGLYEDVSEIAEYMENFLKDKPKMEWRNVDLMEIIGGCENV